MIAARAPGKMILLGEYAVLEGAPALVCAVGCHAKTSVSPANEREFSVTSQSINVICSPFVVAEEGIKYHPGVSAQNRKKLTFFNDLFESIFKQAVVKGIQIAAVNISLDTDAFYSVDWRTKFGFGSSAALAVSLTAALLHKTHLADKKNIFDIALKAHHYAQGNVGSGIDVAASTFGGVLIYEMTLQEEKIVRVSKKILQCDQIQIMPVWSGKSANTRHMVGGVGELKKNNPGLYKETMQRLARISGDGCRAYEKGSVDDFFLCINNFKEILSDLGRESGVPIVSEVHQKISRICEQKGVYYKPSGAGGGDIGVAFSRDREQLIQLAKDLEFYGFRALDSQIVNDGVQVEKYNK